MIELILKDIQKEYNNTRLYISINDDILVDKCYINEKNISCIIPYLYSDLELDHEEYMENTYQFEEWYNVDIYVNNTKIKIMNFKDLEQAERFITKIYA